MVVVEEDPVTDRAALRSACDPTSWVHAAASTAMVASVATSAPRRVPCRAPDAPAVVRRVDVLAMETPLSVPSDRAVIVAPGGAVAGAPPGAGSAMLGR